MIHWIIHSTDLFNAMSFNDDQMNEQMFLFVKNVRAYKFTKRFQKECMNSFSSLMNERWLSS